DVRREGQAGREIAADFQIVTAGAAIDIVDGVEVAVHEEELVTTGTAAHCIVAATEASICSRVELVDLRAACQRVVARAPADDKRAIGLRRSVEHEMV